MRRKCYLIIVTLSVIDVINIVLSWLTYFILLIVGVQYVFHLVVIYKYERASQLLKKGVVAYKYVALC